ncbi:MAG TPA: helix-turn-helix transcriptional regulator, partial [Micromonosporaceae bacterium]
MSGKQGPTLRAQWLGKQLRDLREAAGLTLRDAGEHILRDASTISRMEAGFVPARVPDVLELLNLFRVSDQVVRSALEQLSRDIWRKGWWDGYTGWIPGKIIDLAWLESRAEKFRDFSALVLHGLLQTPEYAKAVMWAADKDVNEGDLELWIEFRMRRREIFDRGNPPEYTSIIDEGALRRQVGGPEVMRAQLAYLLELAEHPSLTLNVLPFTAGAPASPEGAFTYLTMAEPFSDVVQINTEGGAIY